MTREYTVTETQYGKSISYSENGFTYSFTDQDPANTDYQQYLASLDVDSEGNK